ncbi:MAG TPA: allantoinase AllB [Candidatus Dormibacteraeota bacterium]|nr:allantoinase AllB [Candidatus Dormibacteraeota bacterium]
MTSRADIVVRGGRVVTASSVMDADVAVAEGRITEIGARLDVEAGEEIDASGLHVFPGGVDAHVHFNEPGRTEWETFACGSAALAAGGYTSFVDMPLNSLPVTIDADAFDQKLAAAEKSAIVDFGMWGGLVPGNVDQVDPLLDRGVLGFKAFMCPSGIDEFPACDSITLREGMTRIARRGSILLVHAEDPVVLDQHMAAPGGASANDFIQSRPPDAELAAIGHAIDLAAETGCRLHVVHVSTLAGMEMIRAAQGRGVDVSGETCPHYLLYVGDDLQRLGGVGKCFPPFRTASDRDGLWALLVTGVLPMVVSDHSPSTIELKEGEDFFKIWGGLSGCQTTRLLLLARSLDARRLAAATATNVASRFGLAGKGEIAPGYDADLWLADLTYTGVLRREELLYKNPFSAHEGQPVRGRTVRTIRRGETVFAEGKVQVESGGRFMRPASAS